MPHSREIRETDEHVCNKHLRRSPAARVGRQITAYRSPFATALMNEGNTNHRQTQSHQPLERVWSSPMVMVGTLPASSCFVDPMRSNMLVTPQKPGENTCLFLFSVSLCFSTGVTPIY